jgi:hypothetical protein
MILNLYAHEGIIKMPNILLEENKNYEIGLITAGLILEEPLRTQRILEIKYDGIKAMSGPNPYTIMLAVIRSASNFAQSNIVYHPLRTNQLGTTLVKFKVLDAASEFFRTVIRIEIREEKRQKLIKLCKIDEKFGHHRNSQEKKNRENGEQQRVHRMSKRNEILTK